MKFLPPIIAVLVVAAWLGTRHHSIKSLEREVAILEQRIRDAGTTPAGTGTDPSLASRVRSQRDSSLGDSAELDWEQIAKRLASSPSSGPDMRTFASLQQRAIEMSASELAAALDQIDALELPKDVRTQLESILVGQLARKDPQQALERFGDRIGTDRGGVTWQLTEALSRWADDDPAAAGIWFDRQIAAGSFDSTSLEGRNHDRIRFEAAIIGSLLSSSPSAAGARLSAMPENQRSEILNQNWVMKLAPEEHLAFANLARSQLPEFDQPLVLAHTASSMVRSNDGYQRVSDFIESIKATPDELSAIVNRTARDKLDIAFRKQSVDRAAVDEMRAWLTSQSPATADAVTGQSLGHLTGSSKDPEAIFTLAAELHQETGNDQLLASFLANGTLERHPGLAKPLIEEISDPVQREKLRSQFEATPQPQSLPLDLR